MFLDIHSHRNAPYPEGIISVSPENLSPEPDQLYSAGIHPWATAGAGISPLDGEIYAALEKAAASPQVAAIGECGIDILKGGPMFRQLQLFKRHFEISESVGKPLVIHCVKAHDVILGLKRDLQPTQRWIIHGFRGKPATARMLADAEIGVSFGEKFNPESVKAVPDGLLFAETDESRLSVMEIISLLSGASGRDILTLTGANMATLFPSIGISQDQEPEDTSANPQKQT